MKYKLILSLFVFCIFLINVSAWSTDTFNNSLTAENLTFIGNQSIVRYLSIPNSVSLLTQAYFNLTFNNGTQQSGKLSNWTDSYSITGEFGFEGGMRFTPLIDLVLINVTVDPTSTFTKIYLRNETSTGENLTSGTRAGVNFSFNYPLYAGKTYWLVASKDGNHTYGGAGTPLFPKNDSYVNWTRGLNPTTGSEDVDANGGYDILKIVFGDFSVMNTSIVEIQISRIYTINSTVLSNPTTIKIDDIKDIINEFLNTTYLVGSNYIIPFVFHSSDDSIFGYSGMLFSNGGFIEGSQVYNNQTYETSIEMFSINLTYDPTAYTSATGTLIYDGQSFSSTSTGTSTKTFTSLIEIPVVASTQNKSFYWQFDLTNSSGSFLSNSSSHNQIVNPIYLARCNSTINIPYFNFTILEEGSFNNLNASIEAVWKYWLGSGSVNKSFLYSNLSDTVHNYGFCFSPPDKTIYLTGSTNYYSAGYDSRTYYFSNTSKNNASGNIDLYLLATADSDIVTFTVVDDFLSPVQNANIRILRWNLITDTFYLVSEIITSSSGMASSNLRLNDAFYIFVVSVDGVTYLTTDPEKLSTTTKTLQIFLLPTSDIYDIFNNIDYTLIFDNSTNIFEFIYNDPSSTINYGCLKISQLTAIGTILLSNTCEESPASDLTYAITSNGTYTAEGYVIYNAPAGPIYFTLDTLTITTGTAERFLVIERAAQAISLIFIGTMAMIGVALGSIPIGLILIVVSFIVINLAGFLNFSIAFIASMISIIIMIFLALQRRYG